MQEQVAITGLGAVLSSGLGREALRRSIASDARLEHREEEIVPGISRSVARVGDLVPSAAEIPPNKLGQIDTISRYAIEAAGQALKDCGLQVDAKNRDRTGVILGTAYGCLESNIRFDQYERGPDGRLVGVSPAIFKNIVPNAAAGWTAILLGLRGVNLTVSSGRISGSEAISFGFDRIAGGEADVLLAGGMDQVLPMTLLLDPLPDGFAAEAAGVVALESMSHAIARDAKVMGRVLGWSRRLIPSGDEMALVSSTMEELKIRPAQVGAVITSGAGENIALPSAAIWSLKRQLGECYAAWGALATAAACLSFDRLPRSSPIVIVSSTEPGQEGIALAIRRP